MVVNFIFMDVTMVILLISLGVTMVMLLISEYNYGYISNILN